MDLTFNNIIFILLLLKTPKVLSDLTSECRSIESLKIHPLDCCVYPKFYDNPPALTNKCAKLCKEDVISPSFSCLRICLIKESNVIDDGSVNVTLFLKLFYEGSSDVDLKELSPKWAEVVKKSISACESEFPAKWIEMEARYVVFYMSYVTCIRKMNFLNCLDFKATDTCSKMKKGMESCYYRNYEFLHSMLFEEFYYRANSGGGVKKN